MTNKQDPHDKRARQKFPATNTTPVSQLVETPRLNINVRPVQRPSASTAIASIAGEKTGSTATSQPQGVGMMSREMEDNFITELWSTLNVDQKQVEWQLIEYDSRTVQFTLSPRFASSGQTISSGYGARYVNELLKRCSECRSQLLAMRLFSSSRKGDNQDESPMQEFSSMLPPTEPNALTELLSSLLLDPLRSVVRKFNADVMTEVQESSITIRDLTQFSAFLVNFKQGVEKVFSFFKPLMTPSASPSSFLPFGSSTRDSAFSSARAQQQQWQEVTMAEQQWHKFLLLLNAHSPRELADELPVWERMHKEMLEMLGRYVNLLCRLRLLQVPSPISNAPVQRSQSSQSQSSQQWQIASRVGNGAAAAHDSALSRSSSRPSMHHPGSRLPTPMVADASKCASAVCGGEGDGSQFFRPIWTDRLRADLQGAFHHEERIAAGGVTVPGACTFQEIFQQQTGSGANSGSIFKDVVQQLESAASAYRAQYERYIMQGVMEGDRLQTTLAEIKELYSLRAFVHPITCIMRTPNDGWLDTLAGAVRDAVGGESSNQWRLVRRPTPVECIPSEEEMDGSAASSGGDRNKKQPWWSFELECRLQWPVGCVLEGELFAVLDKCVERCQQMLNAYNTIVQLVAGGKDTMGSVLRSRPARRKRLLAQQLQDTVRVIYTVLRSEMESRIEKATAALLQAKTVEEMESVVREWAFGLHSAIAGNEQLHRESYVLTAADTLCGLIDSFQSLQLKCAEDKDSVLAQASSLKVDKMLKKLGRVTQLLTSPLSNYSSLSGQRPSVTSAMGGGEKWTALLPDPSSVAYSIAVLLSR